MKPILSIIIPSYNQAKYLPDAIESAIAQTVKSPIVVIDDGSTDGSLEIAERYPVKVVRQVNKGLASARNTGIMNVETDFILPLDADDILKENCVERITEVIKVENPDIIAPSFKCFGVNNQEIILSQGLTLKHFAQANYIGYFSAFRRSLALAIGGYSPRMQRGYEDYHFWIDLLKRGATLKVLSDVLVMYRTKELSMIHDAQRHHGELMDQIRFDHPELYA